GPAAVQPAAEDQGGAQALLVPQQHEVRVAPGRPPAGPPLQSPPRSSPAGARAARTAIGRLP
ncbi:hypothetical protein ABZ302_37300, partial [Streptomyces sp. NPDC006237]|uniref:hypothetical protein n=1 Tax=Streptomyces sp. NPDC006237 TaxID=3154474 RepID=UPI00339F3D0F